VSDYPRARVDWGLWAASRPAVAIALSFGAVAIEAGLITACFSRSTWYRACAGACGLAVFAGFYLLQGERWLGWWLLLLGFLPWAAFASVVTGRRSVSVGSAGQGTSGVTIAQAAVIAFVIVQQVMVSAFHREIEPLFSAYDMYSTTYASTEAFNARTG